MPGAKRQRQRQGSRGAALESNLHEDLIRPGQRHVLDQQANHSFAILVAGGGVTPEPRQILRQARVALVASGTATIEAALMGCPMVIVYRVGALTYLLGRFLVTVESIGMVNIVAGRRVCPEFVQARATPSAVAGAAGPLLDETPERTRMVEDLRRVSQALGAGGAEARAAEIVIGELTA